MEKTYYAHVGGIAAGSDRMAREAAAMQNAVKIPHSGGPLPTLGSQLERIEGLRSRVGILAERLIGPRGQNGKLDGAPTVYGGILGLIESETTTLRQRIDEMMADIDAIENALS